MGFYFVPYRQPSPPTRFLLITAIGMCHFLPVHHFGMACLAGSKVNIQHVFLKKCVRSSLLLILLLHVYVYSYICIMVVTMQQYDLIEDFNWMPWSYK